MLNVWSYFKNKKIKIKEIEKDQDDRYNDGWHKQLSCFLIKY